MKHLAIYEDFNTVPEIAQDIFGLGFEMVLHNRTVIKGMKYSEDEVKELFGGRTQYRLIDSCYYELGRRFYLNDTEIKRAECAEKNIREYIGNKLEDLDCEIIYYRPMYIDTVYEMSDIRVYAPGASWSSENSLRIKRKWRIRYSEEYKENLPEVINQVKEFAAKYKVTHVLPHGSRIIQDPIKILQEPDKDVETYDPTWGRKESIFTPIEKFNWERYFW